MRQEPRGKLLTISEVSAVLGLKPGTVRAWVAARKLPAVRLSSRCIRIPEEALQGLVKAHLVPSREAR